LISLELPFLRSSKFNMVFAPYQSIKRDEFAGERQYRSDFNEPGYLEPEGIDFNGGSGSGRLGGKPGGGRGEGEGRIFDRPPTRPPSANAGGTSLESQFSAEVQSRGMNRDNQVFNHIESPGDPPASRTPLNTPPAHPQSNPSVSSPPTWTPTQPGTPPSFSPSSRTAPSPQFVPQPTQPNIPSGIVPAGAPPAHLTPGAAAQIIGTPAGQPITGTQPSPPPFRGGQLHIRYKVSVFYKAPSIYRPFPDYEGQADFTVYGKIKGTYLDQSTENYVLYLQSGNGLDPDAVVNNFAVSVNKQFYGTIGLKGITITPLDQLPPTGDRDPAPTAPPITLNPPNQRPAQPPPQAPNQSPPPVSNRPGTGTPPSTKPASSPPATTPFPNNLPPSALAPVLLAGTLLGRTGLPNNLPPSATPGGQPNPPVVLGRGGRPATQPPPTPTRTPDRPPSNTTITNNTTTNNSTTNTGGSTTINNITNVGAECRYFSTLDNQILANTNTTNATLQVASTILDVITNTQLTTINNKLGDELPNGGMSGFLKRFWDSMGITRILSILTFITTVHNAFQLSSAITQTLFSAFDNVLNLFNIKLKDSEGNEEDTSSWVGQEIENLFKTVFGGDTVEAVETNFKKWNRVYQAATNMLDATQGMLSSLTQGLEIVGQYTGKIGNALKRSGAVLENTYDWMNPSPNFHQSKFFRFLNNTEEVVENLEQITSEAVSARDNWNELKEGATEFKTAMNEAVDSKTSEESSAKALSQSGAIDKADEQKPD
jgi:hypothetical protein